MHVTQTSKLSTLARYWQLHATVAVNEDQTVNLMTIANTLNQKAIFTKFAKKKQKKSEVVSLEQQSLYTGLQ